MTANLLNYPQRNSGVAHLSQGSAAEAVGASSFNADSLASFPEDSGSRVAGDVPPMMVRVAAGE